MILCKTFVILALFLNYFAIITSKPAANDALTEAQRKEIENLRAELNEAFDKHEMETVADSGVIVQPKWTQGDKNEKKVDAKVRVTHEGIDEVKALRAEINRAIVTDTFVPSVAGDPKTTKIVADEFSKTGSSKNVFGGLVSSINEVEDEKPVAAKVDLNAANFADDDDNDDEKLAPNVVDSKAFEPADIDLRKLQRLEVSKRRTKEMLILQSIEEDYSFDLGGDVDQWAHIIHAGQEYFIGRSIENLLIIRKNTAQYETGKVLEVGHPITYLETFAYWNTHRAQQEGVILVAVQDKVLWYCDDTLDGQIELYWEWLVGNTVSGLTYFTTESNDYLAVSFNESTRGFYAVNIYQFELETKEFWIAQRLQFQYPCNEITLLDTGRDLILAVPQNNTAVIYTFNPHADDTNHIRFQLRHNIPAEGIESITGFQMGGRTYVALAGWQPQILLYKNGELFPKTVLGNNFGFVELFFAVPARTYRDDLILLVQHRVDFETHGLPVLETLIWDGESFEASIPVPCYMGNHTFYGISCMLDIQRDEGLKGATLLRRDDEINIIVPRHNAESGLFRLNIELMAKNSELLDLQEIHAFLKDWVKEHDDLIAQAEEFVNLPENAQPRPDLTELEWIKTPELNFTGEIDELHINDYVWTDEDTHTDLDTVMNAIEQLGLEINNEYGRKRREINDEQTTLNADTLTVDVVEADEMLLLWLNNEEFFIQNGSLKFDGALKFADLEVLDEASGNRETRKTEADTVRIDSDLEFDEINGISWNDLKKNLIFTNDPVEITKLDIEGDVRVDSRLTVDVLNSLEFPASFLWTNDPAVSIVTAEKTFTGTLTANEVDTDGHINDVNPFDAITLSDPQEWKGLPTFSHLEVSEKLQLNGTVLGADSKNVPINPTLQESNIITADCSFEHLEVHGPIFIEENFDNTTLPILLADLVQRPADPAEAIDILSKKTFATVTFPIDFHVTDKAVSNISIEEFVTVDTPQDLTLTSLNGYVYFYNLSMTGTYDSVDIAELTANAIKIDEPQFSPQTKLNFMNSVRATNMSVHSKLNGVPIATGYQTIHDDLVTPTANFEHLEAKMAQVTHDIVGNAQFNGLDLHEFLKRRTWTDASDTGNIFLNELILDDGINTDKIHGIDAKYLLSFLDQIDELPEMILDGKVQVDHVVVTGEVEVNKLNGYRFDDDIQMTAIWLNRPNYLATSLIFDETLDLAGDLVVLGEYNGENMPDFLEDIVFRTTNSTAEIFAPKSFTQNVVVRGNTTVAAINGVPLHEIATTTRINNFKGKLQINGDLIVNELEISDNFNDVSMSSLARLVRYDKQLEAYVLLGEIPVTRQIFLDDLTVHGQLNEMPNMDEFFEDLMYKNNDCILKGNYTFTGRVAIEKGAYVRSLNDYNMLTMLNNIVLIRDPQAVFIQSPVTFKSAVNAPVVTVAKALTTCELTGCDIAEWINDTLRIDQPQEISTQLRFAAGSLDGNAFFASFLNDIDLSQLITLHTEQNLSSNLLFSELCVDENIKVHGPVNNVDLQQEFNNTLMTSGDQHISTPLTMQSITVLENLQTNAPVNGDKDLREVVALDDGRPFELQSPLYFKNITAHNLRTNNLVSGINLTQWLDDALWLQERPKQRITGNWSVRNLTVNTSTTSSLRQPREKAYNKLCRKYSKMWAKQRKRAYIIKSLEEVLQLYVPNTAEDNIRYAFVLEHKGTNTNYLLVNLGCYTFVYKWNITSRLYEKLQYFESGLIDQVISIPDSGTNTPTLQFLTNYERSEQQQQQQHCVLSGLNMWMLSVGNNITHLRHFETHVTVMKPLFKKHSMKLYGLDKNTLSEIDLYERNKTKVWRLPKSETTQSGSYRFIPSSDELRTDRIIISDSKSFFIVHNETLESVKHRQAFKYSPPLSNQRPNAKSPASIYKPNITEVQKFHFSDFRVVVARILTDLIYRLYLEVNITQLSIPETDLYDEHLVEDFIALIQELQKQQIYPPEIFEDIDLAKLQIPNNPAQVLAARAVQIIWPVIVEIEKVHSYLRDTDMQQHQQHPACVAITNSLGTTVHDVLWLANSQSSAEKRRDYTKDLTAVIERMALLQREIGTIIAQLNIEIRRELNADTESSQSSKSSDPHNKTSTLVRAAEAVPQKLHLAAIGEMLRLEVGSATAPRTLIAVATSNSATLGSPGQHDAIKLYMNVLSGSIFQTIDAYRPHALATLRIRDETLLAFVEDCCMVHVLIYRGVQGFVDFAQFKAESAVQPLIGLSLPIVAAAGDRSYVLAAVLRRKILFYEVQITGLKYAPTELIACP